MKYFKFIVHLPGEGKTENEAWDNAIEKLTLTNNVWQAHCSYTIDYKDRKEMMKNLSKNGKEETLRNK